MSLKDEQTTEPRMEQILQMLSRLAAGDHQARISPSKQHDDLDAIGAGLNMLGEELSTARGRIDHLVKVLRAIRNVNKLIVKEKNRDALIDHACKLLVETQGYSRAWLALVDASARVISFSEAGWGQAFLPLAERMKQGKLPPCGHTALSQAGVVCIHDPSTACKNCPLLDIDSSDEAMVVRLEHQGTIYGLMSVSIPRAFPKDEEELELYHEVASDLAHALFGIEQEEERKHTLEELRHSNRRFVTLFEGAAEGIMLADGASTHLEYCNPAFCKMLGYPAEELKGMSIADIHPPEDLERVISELDAEARGIKSQATYIPCLRKDGTIIYADIRTTMIVIDGRKFNAGFYTETTEIKHANEKLLLLERAFKTTRTGITIKDCHSRILYSNPADVRMHGFSSAEELAGKKADIFGPPEARKPLSPEEMNATGGLAREGFNVRKDGSRFPVYLISDIVRNDDDKPIGIVTVCEDITERKQAQEELKESHRQLKEATSQLIQSEKLSAMGELAAGVAHELNQPLNGIKIISQSILRYLASYDPQSLENDLEEIIRLVDAMTQVIDHMRFFSRRSDGEMRSLVDLNDLVDRALMFLGQELRDQGIELILKLDRDLPEISGDPVRLEQVFLNLITNARDALRDCQKENRVIEIRTYLSERGIQQHPASVVVAISDNGIGIPEEFLENIFLPFVTSKDPGKGTGLGLSIASKIIEQSGGKIEVVSQEGTQTRFSVHLPVCQGDG